MRIFRNKKCKNCPQNKREDIVWMKGYVDGFEVGALGSKEYKKILGRLYWRKY